MDICKEVYRITEESEVTLSANVITCHVIYKKEERRRSILKMKARLVLHSNRDREQLDVRKDSANIQFDIILLMLSLLLLLGCD